jgi:hypothetical protein
MKEYKNVRSSARPQDIEITNNAVYLAKNIAPYEEDFDGRVVKGFQYDCFEYTKDEYLIKLTQENANLHEQIIDTQLALVELYEGE